MKHEIIPGFILEPGKTEKGYVPLRVLTKEIAELLTNRGYLLRIQIGYSSLGADNDLTPAMIERYGGKKLKIYTIKRVGFKRTGVNFTFHTSDIDTYRWYPYMFIEYWEHLLGEKLYTKKEKTVARKENTTINGLEFKPGQQSLRVVTRDYLKKRGVNPDTLGSGFLTEMEERYAGKKLKLKKTDKRNEELHASLLLIFSDSDTYNWNEYMFEEYWNYVDSICKYSVKKEETVSCKKETVSCKKESCKCDTKAVLKEVDKDMDTFMKGFQKTEIDTLNARVTQLAKELATAKSLLKLAESENANLISRNEELGVAIEEMLQNNEGYAHEIFELSEENKALETENEELADEVKKISKKMKMFLLMTMGGKPQA